MENLNLVETFSEFKEFKNIDRKQWLRILEDVFKHMLTKRFGSADNFDIIVNIDREILKFSVHVLSLKMALLKDENTRSLSEQSRSNRFWSGWRIVGERSNWEVSGVVKFLPSGRTWFPRSRNTKRTMFTPNIVKKSVKSSQVRFIRYGKRRFLFWMMRNWSTSPEIGADPSDFYRKGDSIRAVVSKVEMKNNNPVIILSRTSEAFLERLFESEVPEVYDGLINIKKIVRVPGERAKIAGWILWWPHRSGRCMRRHEGQQDSWHRPWIEKWKYWCYQLYYESVVVYPAALSPAKVTSIVIVEEEKRADVYMKPDQVSLPSGRVGTTSNWPENSPVMKSMFTAIPMLIMRMSISRNFLMKSISGSLMSWKPSVVIQPRAFLALDVEELVKRTDLEEETINEVVRILKAEFE